MKITKEQILKMIQEEIGEEMTEGFFSRLFGGDKEEEAPEKASAEEPEESEEPDNDCGTDIYGDPYSSGEDIYALASKLFKNLSSKDLDVYEWKGLGPMSLLKDIGRIVKKEGASSISPFIEAGSRYTKYGKELSFRYLGNALSNAVKRGRKYQFGPDGPCVDGGELGTAISYAFGEADAFEEAPKVKRQRRDVDHLLSRHEGKIRQAIKGSHRISRLEEMIREEIGKAFNLEKEDK